MATNAPPLTVAITNQLIWAEFESVESLVQSGKETRSQINQTLHLHKNFTTFLLNTNEELTKIYFHVSLHIYSADVMLSIIFHLYLIFTICFSFKRGELRHCSAIRVCGKHKAAVICGRCQTNKLNGKFHILLKKKGTECLVVWSVGCDAALESF